MKNILIVFSGKAQAGKSTSANVLKKLIETNHPNLKVEIFSFASKLKQIARELFFWDNSKELYYLPSDINKQNPLPDVGRQLLINIGQKMRDIRPTVWVDYVIRSIKDKDKEVTDTIFIIDDLRFKNELNLAKTFHDCISIRLSRPSSLNLTDISEVDLDNETFDYYIENNFDLEKLQSDLEAILLKHI